MHKFVDEIASFLLESNTKLNDWTIILPSERAKNYVQKALFDKMQKPFFAPKILTINHWVASLSDKAILDKTRLLIYLYEIHKSYPDPTLDLSFDEFLNWGNTLVSDFDELERYLVNPKELFKNLRDIKEIENWNFGEDKELTENQKKYLAFWDRLPFYYENLHKKLKQTNSVFIGLVYRDLAENIDKVFKENKNTKFLFAGFNALSTAEISIFKQMYRLGKAEILINADDYYLKDFNHEAGMFLRKLIQELEVKTLNYSHNRLVTEQKEIEIISCAQITGQVKVISNKLAELNENELNETLVLLADESLIIALLQNIPKSVKKANITLGLPLGNTALKTWVEMLFNIQEGKIRYNRDGIYYKDLLAFWNHPFLQEIITEEEKKIIYEKEKNIHHRNILFQSLNSIKISEKIDKITTLVFLPWKNVWQTAIDTIRQLNALVFEKLSKDKEFERAIIQGFDTVIVDFQNCVHSEFPDMNLRSFKVLFNQAWAKQSMAYYGNPIEGLQIMGLLETRLLDFKRIFILGMNEGKMPPSNPILSLIPMDLRRHLKMPTSREKQGLFAHHFYRLLHHCETMVITYYNGSEGFAVSEKSRFISQLELEWIPLNPNIKLVQRDYSLLQNKNQTTEIKVNKSEEVLLQLDAFCENGVSASKLKSFFTCSLDFYYKHILKFGEEEKLEEELESNTFGTLIHATLEELYKPYLCTHDSKIALTPAHIQKMLKTFKDLLFQAFKKHFNEDEDAFLKGKNYLSYEMAQELTKQFLLSELDLLTKNPEKSLYILGLEEDLQTEVKVEINGETKVVRLKGFIDRVDSWDGQLRIIDYKSGKINDADVSKVLTKKEVDLTDLFALCKSSKYIFQLLTYAFLYYDVKNTTPDFSSIYSLISYKKNPFHLKIGALSIQELLDHYPLLLEEIMQEVYDVSQTFEHNIKANYCAYCK